VTLLKNLNAVWKIFQQQFGPDSAGPREVYDRLSNAIWHQREL
jgi:hypothetical protein